MKKNKNVILFILSILLFLIFLIELLTWGGGHPVHPNSDFWISSDLLYIISNSIGLILSIVSILAYIFLVKCNKLRKKCNNYG